MSTEDADFDEGQGFSHAGAALDELEGARKMLRAMGVEDVEGTTISVAFAMVLTTTMKRHAEFMNAFGAELVAAGVSGTRVNDCAQAAGLAMLQRSWGCDE